MKTISFCTAIIGLLLSFSACEKANNDPEIQNENELVGIWYLTHISGGFAGTGYPADFTEVEFKADGTYRINNHDEAKGDGTYTLTNNDQIVLKFTPSDSIKIGFEEYAKTVRLEQEKLILSDPCCDLFEYEFGKSEN